MRLKGGKHTDSRGAQALKKGSKLLVLADYGIGEIEDEYRFEYGN